MPAISRDIVAELQRYTRGNTGKICRWLYPTWNAERRAIKYSEITAALRSGQVNPAWLELWRQDYARFVTARLEPSWRAAWAAGQKTISANVSAYIGAEFQASAATEFARRWLEERGAELAVNLTRAQHEALKVLLRHFVVEEPLSAAELGRAIRGVIGLTQREANAFARARAAWRAEASVSEAEARAASYWGRLHRKRALRIARTEISHAYNTAQYDAIRQASAQGLFGGPVMKVWDAAPSACKFCANLHGTQIGLEGNFDHIGTAAAMAAGTAQGPTPPAHSSCACGIIYQVLEAR